MLNRNRETDSFTVSFLDVASCGFGAMIILLMIVKPSSPSSIEASAADPSAAVAELQREVFEVRGQTSLVNRDLNAKREQLSATIERVARLRQDLSDVQGEFSASSELSDEATDEIGRLSLAQQSLTDEMQRLFGSSQQVKDQAIGGIPVDSEYIIFVIDTSGSDGFPRLPGPNNLFGRRSRSETSCLAPATSVVDQFTCMICAMAIKVTRTAFASRNTMNGVRWNAAPISVLAMEAGMPFMRAMKPCCEFSNVSKPKSPTPIAATVSRNEASKLGEKTIVAVSADTASM